MFALIDENRTRTRCTDRSGWGLWGLRIGLFASGLPWILVVNSSRGPKKWQERLREGHVVTMERTDMVLQKAIAMAAGNTVRWQL